MKQKIVSINIGKPSTLKVEGSRAFRSAIHKQPVSGKIFLDFLGLEGDAVADPRHHGGPDKAVCIYSAEHYAFWEKELERALQPGAFGENLTLRGLTETEVRIGDVFEIGEARIQCTQPRQPCHKLNKVFNRKEMACRIQTTGFSGFYVRVLKQGWVESGLPVQLVQQDPGAITVEEANRLMHQDKDNHERIREIIAVPALSESWRLTFKKRLSSRS